MHVDYKEYAFQVQGFFDEWGTTGVRDAMVYAMLANEGKVEATEEGIKGWNEVFVRKQALELLMACDGWFHIYGKQEPFWHCVLDETDVLLHPDPEKYIVTAGYDDLDEFVNELDLSIHARTLVPHDVFLLYDDPDLYREVLRRLGIVNK